MFPCKTHYCEGEKQEAGGNLVKDDAEKADVLVAGSCPSGGHVTLAQLSLCYNPPLIARPP